ARWNARRRRTCEATRRSPPTEAETRQRQIVIGHPSHERHRSVPGLKRRLSRWRSSCLASFPRGLPRDAGVPRLGGLTYPTVPVRPSRKNGESHRFHFGLATWGRSVSLVRQSWLTSIWLPGRSGKSDTRRRRESGEWIREVGASRFSPARLARELIARPVGGRALPSSPRFGACRDWR